MSALFTEPTVTAKTFLQVLSYSYLLMLFRSSLTWSTFTSMAGSAFLL